MTEYQIIKDSIVIGRYRDKEDRDFAFDEYCIDRTSSYLKKEK